MCGIAGVIKTEPVSPADIGAVERMLGAQVHRGPDDSGLHSASHAILGHRRLSIIDLSAAGRQPMSNEDGTIWVTYNGEIYNFQELRAELKASGHFFQSNSDTEVIVHGYEQWDIEGLLARLRGMYAFAIHDAKLGLILARDRLGIKPLYYYDSGRSLLFASEVKALSASEAVPKERDREALTGFLLAGSIPSPLTIIRNVRSLEQGSYLVWTNGNAKIYKYWDLKDHYWNGKENHEAPLPTGRTEAPSRQINRAVAGALQPILRDAAARHLITDVPLGIFLSGGVGSAALVALASRAQRAPLVTLTVTFEEQDFSEAAPARAVAAHFKTNHHEVPVTAADFRRGIPRILSAMDQPTNDGVNTWFVSKAAREAGVKVVLSGAGGDEVFWGYRHYRTLGQVARWLNGCPDLLRKAMLRGGVTLGRIRGRESWMRLAYMDGGVSSQALYLSLRGFFAPHQVRQLLELSERELNDAVEQQFCPNLPTGIEAFNYLETKRYLHDQLLRDTDVFSMSHSLEVRVPFLDHKIVEYAASVRPSHKIANGLNKPLLVDAVNSPAVLETAKRTKRGFSFPMASWMKSCAPELESMADSTVLDRKTVRDCWSKFTQGRLHWSRAWAITLVGVNR